MTKAKYNCIINIQSKDKYLLTLLLKVMASLIFYLEKLNSFK